MTVRRILPLDLLLALLAAPAAQAAFPGANGSLVVSRFDRGPVASPTPTPTPGPFPTQTPAPAPSDSGLYSFDSSGGAVTRLTSFGFELSPTFAPDGRTVAFIRSGSICLVVIGVSAATCPNIVGQRFVQNPAWSPDGQRLLFDATRRSEPDGYAGPDLYVVNRDGSDLRMLVDGHSAQEAAWAPDGSRIVFSGRATRSSTDSFELFSVAPDGSGLTRLTNTSEWERRPDWAPDSSRIAYEIGGKLRTIAADGTDDRLVGDAVSPAYSPDGKYIAASIRGSEGGDRIAIFPAEGGTPTEITPGGRFDDSSVTWGRVPDPLPSPTPSPSPSTAAEPTTTPGPLDLRLLLRQVARQVQRGGLPALRRGRKLTVTPPAAGTVNVRVAARGTLVARGAATSASGDAVALALRRTAAGRRLLRDRKRLTAKLTVGFTAPGTPASRISTVRTLSNP